MFTLFGAWRNMVARLLWEQEVAGSNPVAPTIFLCPMDDPPSLTLRGQATTAPLRQRDWDDRSLRSLGRKKMLYNLIPSLITTRFCPRNELKLI